MRLTNIRQSRKFLTLITLSTLGLAVPFTAFQYLDLRYKDQHREELQYVVQRSVDLYGRTETVEYGQHPTPWATAAHASSLALLILPAVIAIAGSCLLFLKLVGTLRQRYAHATLMALTIIPVFFLGNLPWALIYWDGWEWEAGIFLTIVYGVAVTIIAALVNATGIAVMNKRHTMMVDGA